MFRSLAAQIIHENQDLAVYVHDVYFRSHLVPSKKALLALLPELLHGLGSVRFVVDGVDEWDATEQRDLLKELTTLLSASPSCVCKILISSRETLEMSRGLRGKNKAAASMSLGDSKQSVAVDRSIADFVDGRLSDLPDHVEELDPDAVVLARLRRAIIAKSNGRTTTLRMDKS